MRGQQGEVAAAPQHALPSWASSQLGRRQGTYTMHSVTSLTHITLCACCRSLTQVGSASQMRRLQCREVVTYLSSRSSSGRAGFVPPGLLASAAISAWPCRACLYFESSTHCLSFKSSKKSDFCSGFGGRMSAQALGFWGPEELLSPGC